MGGGDAASLPGVRIFPFDVIRMKQFYLTTVVEAGDFHRDSALSFQWKIIGNDWAMLRIKA